MVSSDTLDLRIAEEGLEQVVMSVLSRLDGAPEGERRQLVTALEDACGVTFGEDKQRWERWVRTLDASGVTRFGPLPPGQRESLPADGKMVADMVDEITGGPTPEGSGDGPGERQPVEDLADDALLQNVAVHEGYKVLGGVVIYQKLGQGGMGAVYRGKHLRLDIDVAVKVMAPPAGMARAEIDGFVKRFLREAKTAASINHTNLVRVIDVNTESGLYYLVMDFIDGESAGERLRRKSQLSEAEAAELMLGAAEGLAEAHRDGIVHRDVKPDNIMVDKRGRVRVTDLGLAKAYHGQQDGASALTQTQSAMGTPVYMAPEQFTNARDVGPQADVWSLGVTLFHLISGEVPWIDSSPYAIAFKVAQEPFPDIKLRRPDVSAGMCAIIGKATEKDPAARYSNCTEMTRELRRHMATLDAPESGVLSDDAAGASKAALARMAPPDGNTLTLIADRHLQGAKATPSAKRPSALDTLADAPASAPGLPAQKETPKSATTMPILIGVLGVLILVGVVLASMLAGSDGEKIDPKDDAVAEANSDEHMLAAAVHSADKAEKDGDLKDAIAFLERAAELAKDEDERARIGDRMKELEVRVQGLELRDALAEAQRLEMEGELAEARALYERVSGGDADDLKKQADDRLAVVRELMALREAITDVKDEVERNRWSEAWARLKAAGSDGHKDTELDELARQVADKLAPPPKRTAPLGTELVLLPGGRFTMGNDRGRRNERPTHTVTLSPFYIGKCEVTSAQFAAFRARRRTAPEDVAEAGTLPVTGISPDEASSYCRYLSSLDEAGATYRLPTEAEWEFAARGAAGRTYPWGGDAPDATRANLAFDAEATPVLTPVGQFEAGATPEGVMDLIGNAAEWCSDRYGKYQAGAATDPKGPQEGDEVVVRGSAYAYGVKQWSRASARGVAAAGGRMDTIGFRVVRELTPDESEKHKVANRD